MFKILFQVEDPKDLGQKFFLVVLSLFSNK